MLLICLGNQAEQKYMADHSSPKILLLDFYPEHYLESAINKADTYFVRSFNILSLTNMCALLNDVTSLAKY